MVNRARIVYGMRNFSKLVIMITCCLSIILQAKCNGVLIMGSLGHWVIIECGIARSHPAHDHLCSVRIGSVNAFAPHLTYLLCTQTLLHTATKIGVFFDFNKGGISRKPTRPTPLSPFISSRGRNVFNRETSGDKDCWTTTTAISSIDEDINFREPPPRCAAPPWHHSQFYS